MTWRCPLFLAVLVLSLASGAGTALAHGATIHYETRTALVVTIHATFDTGDPMAGGQVTIYTPDDPLNPWETGVCDAQGRYTFTPDPAIPGTWEVQVRQAGHGDMVYVDVAPSEDNTAPAATTSQLTGPGTGAGYTPLQYVVMGVAVVWGFVGTALYFAHPARRRP